MIERYCDPATGLVGLHQDAAGKDCDNHLLFTATATVLFGEPSHDRLLTLVAKCRLESGVFVRYPGETDPTSWDDLLGLSVAHPLLATEILRYATLHDWTWGDQWLGRIPLLAPTVMAGAGVKLSLFSQLRAAACFLQNLWEPRGETSGHCLCYLASKVLEHHGGLLTAVIGLWRAVMKKKYPGGMREVYAIYFGASHPFALHGPTSF